MPKRKFRVELNPMRDVPLLLALWKWKVLTTAALTHKFFPKTSPQTAYRRLWALERSGFIEARVDIRGRSHVWLLTKEGFTVVRPGLPGLKDDGFKSEHIGHDLVTSALHLGDWLLASPEGVKLCSEQQLRRYHKKDLPHYVPQNDTRRADGYTFIPNGTKGKVIAIEVELHIKRKADYDDTAYFYEHEAVDQVLWLVAKPQNAKSLLQNLMRHSYVKETKHSFIAFDDFFKRGWHAPIICGKDQGKSVPFIFNFQSYNKPETNPQPVFSQVMLNVSKTPHRSKTSKFYEIGHFTN